MKGKAGTSFDITSPWKVDPRVLRKLEGSFFHSIANMKAYKQCHVFQGFIKDCYDTTTRTFTFGSDRNIRLYFGLEDVYALSGMPVDGKPIICDDIPTEKLCMDMLGSYKLCGGKKMQISKTWLRQTFEAVPEDLTDLELTYHVRAYLLYLIGTKILPNSDNSIYFPAYWLQFLENVNAFGLNSFAWGVAAHCLLTSTISSNTSDGFLGPSWLYEMFFCERIPKINDIFLGVDLSDEPEKKDIPLHEYYCRRMAGPGRRTNKKFDLKKDLVEIRHNMTDELQYHEPEKAPRQLSIENLEEVGDQEHLQRKMARGTTQRNYCKRYAKYIKMWKNERHLEKNCIKDTSLSFALPLCPEQRSTGDEMIEEEYKYEPSSPLTFTGEREYEETEGLDDDETLSVYIEGNKRPVSDRSASIQLFMSPITHTTNPLTNGEEDDEMTEEEYEDELSSPFTFTGETVDYEETEGLDDDETLSVYIERNKRPVSDRSSSIQLFMSPIIHTTNPLTNGEEDDEMTEEEYEDELSSPFTFTGETVDYEETEGLDDDETLSVYIEGNKRPVSDRSASIQLFMSPITHTTNPLTNGEEDVDVGHNDDSFQETLYTGHNDDSFQETPNVGINVDVIVDEMTEEEYEDEPSSPFTFTGETVEYEETEGLDDDETLSVYIEGNKRPVSDRSTSKQLFMSPITHTTNPLTNGEEDANGEEEDAAKKCQKGYRIRKSVDRLNLNDKGLKKRKNEEEDDAAKKNYPQCRKGSRKRTKPDFFRPS
ncbi:hypothetical protein E3N88_11752 [Mikania micrantha]|uniref:Aminotransferase-like plant mobile domain-containing protein n=1 Tax=Mikania micrantha TaxID=192012 RepID=A0A5N6P5K8_9ASTR|nr:hypothetical protein E3N88_11752 [Mikania micrantha]